MQIKRVKIALLKNSSYNPPERISEDSKQLKELIKSIEEVGLLYPLLLDKADGLTIIDGHRRCAAMKALGYEEVPAILVASENPDKIYAEVNAEAKPLKGKEKVLVWLMKPTAVKGKFSEEMKDFEETFGRSLIEKACKHGLSETVFRRAITAASYVGEADNTQFMIKAAKWVIQYRASNLITSYIRVGAPANRLKTAINRNKPLVSMIK